MSIEFQFSYINITFSYEVYLVSYINATQLMDFLTKHWFDIFCNQFIELMHEILKKNEGFNTFISKILTDSELSTQNIL